MISITQLRPGMTALAAVIALSSTPLLAQAQPADAPAVAPVTVAPPPPAATPMVVAPAEATTEATTDNASAPIAAPPAAPVAQPVETMRTSSTPIVHAPDPAEAAPVVTRSARPRFAPPVAVKPAPVAKAAARTAKGEPALAPIAPLPVRPALQSAPQPIATTTTRSTVTAGVSTGTLEIAGVAGAAMLALAGGGLLIARRRREDEIDAAAAPVLVDAPVAHVATAADLSEDFDTSRFGRHVRAAYAGPTPENPSLSLRKRLARARFFDQREREAGTTTPHAMEQIEDVASPWSPRRAAGFVTSRLRRPAVTSFRPAFQG